MNLEGPAKHQPKTSTVEDEDEWEDALVVSYVPQPIAWDDHPTGRQLNKLLESVHFEQHSLPIAPIGGQCKVWKSGQDELTLVNAWLISSVQVVIRGETGYTLNTKHAFGERFPQSTNGQLHISNGGKFLIIAEFGHINANIVLWRLDLADSSLHKILDVPKDRPIIPDLEHAKINTANWQNGFVSNKYAYFAAKDILFRVDVQTGDLKLVFQVRFEIVRNQPEEELHDFRMEFYKRDVLIIATALRKDYCIRRRIRLIKERTCQILHTADSEKMNSNAFSFYTQFVVLREGVILKTSTGRWGKSCVQQKNQYALYSLKNWRLLAKHEVENRCQYSKDWFSINYFRLWGFPVFIESVFIDTKNSYHFSLSILFKSRFHQLTTPCPIDMRYKKIDSIKTVIQPDPKLTELIVEVSGLTQKSPKPTYLLRLKL